MDTRILMYLRKGLAALLVWMVVGPVVGGDWPQWRYDAGHSAASPDALPGELHLQWTRQYSPREPVWDDTLNRDMMPYDRNFEPVVAGDRMFLSFNDADKVAALDVRDGTELWAFYADGPVRFPPVVFEDSVLFTSDDGYLYCVGAADGQLRWRVLGGPSERKVIGNRRHDLVLAGPRRSRCGRRHSVFCRQHLAVHGHVHLCLGCPHGPGAMAERCDGRPVSEAAARRAVLRRRRAAGPVGGGGRTAAGAGRQVAAGGVRPGVRPAEILQFRRQGAGRIVRGGGCYASLCAHPGARHDGAQSAQGNRGQVSGERAGAGRRSPVRGRRRNDGKIRRRRLEFRLTMPRIKCCGTSMRMERAT
jgi:hypothetical protein